jgi:hypothetical protein
MTLTTPGLEVVLTYPTLISTLISSTDQGSVADLFGIKTCLSCYLWLIPTVTFPQNDLGAHRTTSGAANGNDGPS